MYLKDWKNILPTSKSSMQFVQTVSLNICVKPPKQETTGFQNYYKENLTRCHEKECWVQGIVEDFLDKKLDAYGEGVANEAGDSR